MRFFSRQRGELQNNGRLSPLNTAQKLLENNLGLSQYFDEQ